MASCICNLRRVLHPSSTCLNSCPSIFARMGHVASSEGCISGGAAATKGSSSQKSDTVGPEDKRADKVSRLRDVWAPDPVTGYYRPIDQATEARENAARDKK